MAEGLAGMVEEVGGFDRLIGGGAQACESSRPATACRALAVGDHVKPIRFTVDKEPPKVVTAVWNVAYAEGAAPPGARHAPPGLGRSGASVIYLPLPGAGIISGARPEAFRLHKDRPESGRVEMALSLVTRGRRRIEQRGRAVEGGVGSAVFVSNADDGHIACEADGRYLSVQVARELLLGRVPDVESRLMQPIAPDSAPLRLLSGYVSRLMKFEAGLDRDSARAVSDHLVDLSALLLGAKGDERALAESRGLRAAQTAAICEAIDGGAADPEFSARTVASRLGVSPRYVHYLLEETGKGFASRVAARKLDIVRERLADPRFDRMSIPELAFACGFADLPEFERRFRALFGDAPAAFRASRR